MSSLVPILSHRQDVKRPNIGRSGKWSPFFISSDVSETRHAVGRAICDHVLEHRSGQKRPITVQYRNAHLKKLILHDMRYSMFDGEARIHVPNMSHIFLCEFNLLGESHVGQTHPDHLFQAGQVYMINADQPHTKRWESDGHQLMVMIHRNDLEAAVERATGLPVREPLEFLKTPMNTSGKLATLAQLVDMLSDDLNSEHSFFGEVRPDGARSSIEDVLIDLVLEAIPNNYSQRLAKPEPLIRPRHVRHAAEFIHLNTDENITLKDLIAAAGVSERSLHAGFHKYYGVSPMTYLRNVRLDRARLALKDRQSGPTSVTVVALDSGFAHLSKFSQAYRDRFGELPSETLRNV